MSDPMTMTNDEAHDFLASRMSPEDARKLGAAIRAIRAKAIKDAEEWGLSGVPEGAASDYDVARAVRLLESLGWRVALPPSPVPSPEPLDVEATLEREYARGWSDALGSRDLRPAVVAPQPVPEDGP